MKSLSIALLLVCVSLAFGFCDVPVRNEQLIYTSLAFNGKDYSATFVPAESDTIYLLSGVDNFLSVRKTLVYFWALTGEWKTDTDNLDVFLPGSLELREGRGTAQMIPLVWFTYFNVSGEYELNWKVAVGDAAKLQYKSYQSLYAAYSDAVADYQAKTAAYETEIEKLAARIRKLREAGMDFTALLERLKTLPKPEQPQPPRAYVIPPSAPQQAFRLNLPRGEYTVRLINPDGTVMEGSEKKIVIHEKRRTNGVGFNVIPSDKWTRPEESKTPSAVLYVNGSTDLYLQAFFEDEFNDLHYAKTMANQATGNPNMYEWVRIQQVPHASLELQAVAGFPSLITEAPYYVEQIKGSTLGYTIVPFTGQGGQEDKEPNLIAFHVPISRSVSVLRLRALSSDGHPLTGSERQIRIIQISPRAMIIFVFSLLPLAIMGIVLKLRARIYSA
jgi:hypothetical protein